MLRKCCNILLALTAKQRETMLFLFGFFGFKMFLSFENNQQYLDTYDETRIKGWWKRKGPSFSFSFKNNSKKLRTTLEDGSRSLGLFSKGKHYLIAELLIYGS